MIGQAVTMGTVISNYSVLRQSTSKGMIGMLNHIRSGELNHCVSVPQVKVMTLDAAVILDA